jgi:hypothetical protein
MGLGAVRPTRRSFAAAAAASPRDRFAGRDLQSSDLAMWPGQTSHVADPTQWQPKL